MTWTQRAICANALLGLASCAPAPNDACAGWEPLQVSAETVDYMAAHDTAGLRGMIAHNEFGQARGCWK